MTVTTPEDIGALTAEILFAEPRIRDEIVFVAGDTITYGQLAETSKQSSVVRSRSGCGRNRS